jgi:hypothetical protein
MYSVNELNEYDLNAIMSSNMVSPSCAIASLSVILGH